MQKVDGVSRVHVSLNDGLTILDLKPGNAVTLAKLRQIIKSNGFVSKEASVLARGSANGGQSFVVSGTKEQRTVVLGRDLDQIRQQQASADLETKKLAAALEDVQKALPTSSDPSQRRGAEFEEQALKRMLTQQAAIEDRLRTREAEAAQLL